MKCNNCGVELRPNEKFCHNCGTRLFMEDNSEKTETNGTNYSEFESSKQASSNNAEFSNKELYDKYINKQPNVNDTKEVRERLLVGRSILSKKAEYEMTIEINNSHSSGFKSSKQEYEKTLKKYNLFKILSICVSVVIIAFVVTYIVLTVKYNKYSTIVDNPGKSFEYAWSNISTIDELKKYSDSITYDWEIRGIVVSKETFERVIDSFSNDVLYRHSSIYDTDVLKRIVRYCDSYLLRSSSIVLACFVAIFLIVFIVKIFKNKKKNVKTIESMNSHYTEVISDSDNQIDKTQIGKNKISQINIQEAAISAHISSENKLCSEKVDGLNKCLVILNGVISDKYKNKGDVDRIVDIFDDQRASNLSDAVNVMIEDKRREEEIRIEREKAEAEMEAQRRMAAAAERQARAAEQAVKDAREAQQRADQRARDDARSAESRGRWQCNTCGVGHCGMRGSNTTGNCASYIPH